MSSKLDLAPWWRRALAFGVDLVIAVFLNLFPLLIVSSFLDDGLLTEIILTIVFIGIAYGIYAPMLMSRLDERHGQTFGKGLLKIRAVAEDGSPIASSQILQRELLCKGALSLCLVGAFAIFILPIALVNFLAPLFDKQNRALHDRLAKTRVIRA